MQQYTQMYLKKKEKQKKAEETGETNDEDSPVIFKFFLAYLFIL